MLIYLFSQNIPIRILLTYQEKNDTIRKALHCQRNWTQNTY